MKAASESRRDSNAVLREWCAAVTGSVLSIGSSRDSDGMGNSYRSYFLNATSYQTSEPKPGCDLVLDVRAMPSVESGTHDAVFCSGVLEHVDDVHAAVRECHRVLKPGGLFFVGVPFKQPIHRAPDDFWRFTEYGLKVLLRDFQIDDMRVIGEPVFPTAYWVRARKS